MQLSDKSKFKLPSRQLLPNEPWVQDGCREQALTELLLTPVLPSLEAYFLEIRALVDPGLRQRQPVKLGKPYPLGQCLEIALAVMHRLREVNESNLAPKALAGHRALRAFLRAGGVFRQVWGDLRGQYFQNAFQLGTLYIDVSNDTVVPTKPKVEILPFADAQFIAIADYRHFSRIATRYWQHQIYPNHVLPELAPHCPLIHVSPTGSIRLHATSRYMLAMTQAKRFEPSEAVLGEAPMPEELFVRVVHALKDGRHKLAHSPEHGRQLALQYCRQYRAKRWHQSPQQSDKASQAVHQANMRLEDWHKASMAQAAPKREITIDNFTYDLDTLSPEARGQLTSLQFVDAELARLQAHTAVLQTARMAYSKALQAALPESPVSDTMNFNLMGLF